MHDARRDHRPSTIVLATLLCGLCACSPPGAEPPVVPTPSGPMQLVRDHAVRPSIDDTGTIVAMYAFTDASFEEIAGVLVHDLAAGTAVRADRTPDGGPGDATFLSAGPVLSGDGTRVAHVSDATNLAPATDPLRTVFVTDLASGVTEVVTLDDAGADTGCVDRPDLSRDGGAVLFNHHAACYTSSFSGSSMYLKDGGSSARVSHDGSERSLVGALAADGAAVAFESDDTAGFPGDTNGFTDVFVRDLVGDTVERVSLAHDGSQPDAHVLLAPRGMSADGRLVLMSSSATNLVPGDTNGFVDVFVFDRVTGAMARVSTRQDGGELSGASFHARISRDGRYVVFATLALDAAPGLTAPGVHRLFVKELATGALARVDLPEGGDPQLGIRDGEFDVSGDGRYVVFVSGNALTAGAEEGSLAVYRVVNPLWAP